MIYLHRNHELIGYLGCQRSTEENGGAGVLGSFHKPCITLKIKKISWRGQDFFFLICQEARLTARSPLF